MLKISSTGHDKLCLFLQKDFELNWKWALVAEVTSVMKQLCRHTWCLRRPGFCDPHDSSTLPWHLTPSMCNCGIKLIHIGLLGESTLHLSFYIIFILGLKPRLCYFVAVQLWKGCLMCKYSKYCSSFRKGPVTSEQHSSYEAQHCVLASSRFFICTKTDPQNNFWTSLSWYLLSDGVKYVYVHSGDR